ncbi:MAG: hypothetical protein RSB59_04685 [Clostridia bacterium]
MEVNAVRKEDEIYFEGTWWLIAKSMDDLLMGNYEIVGEMYSVDYNGNYIGARNSTMMQEHMDIWSKYSKKYTVDGKEVPYNYFPRGRVAIMDGGKAYIYMPKKAFTPNIYDAIKRRHNLKNLDVHLSSQSSERGEHYEFMLK